MATEEFGSVQRRLHVIGSDSEIEPVARID
jgi:hypothetical protein